MYSWFLFRWSRHDMATLAMFVGGSFLVMCLFEGRLTSCLWSFDKFSDFVVPSGVCEFAVQLSGALHLSALLLFVRAAAVPLSRVP